MGNFKEYVRKIRNSMNWLFKGNKVKVHGKGNEFNRNVSCNIRHTNIVIKGNNNKVLIGDNCSISGLRILIEGDNNIVDIGAGTGINASVIQPTVINAFGGKKIQIGEGCLFSNNIEIHTTDYHGIYDTNGNRINYDKDIIIGKKVWLCLGVKILKGTEIADGCIVGAGSLLAGQYKEKNTVIAGNPGKIIKKQVHWNPERKDKITQELLRQ